MGVVAVGRALIGRLFGGGAAAPGAAAGVNPLSNIFSTLFGGARAIAPAVAGGAAFQAGLNLVTSGGGAVAAAAGPGGSRMVRLEDGSQILVSAQGRPARAQLFLPAGSKLPSGATVVSVSADGNLFGIRKARRKRSFQGEIDRSKAAIQSARSLLTVCSKK